MQYAPFWYLNRPDISLRSKDTRLRSSVSKTSTIRENEVQTSDFRVNIVLRALDPYTVYYDVAYIFCGFEHRKGVYLPVAIEDDARSGSS